MLKKSLLTILLTAMVGVMAAQSLQFEWNGTVFEAGQTLICPFDEEYGEFLQHLQIRNLTDNDMNVAVMREIFELPEGALNYFCWGMCYGPDVDFSRGEPIPAQSVSESELSIHFMIEEGTGVASINFYAYDENDPTDIISLHLLAGNGAQVAEQAFEFGHAYPNPASNQVSFNVKGHDQAEATVVVYNLLGQEVKSQSYSALQGRIDVAVDDLQPGIYFCNFVVAGRVLKTEKFVVKR